jgi:hypothetical protein
MMIKLLRLAIAAALPKTTQPGPFLHLEAFCGLTGQFADVPKRRSPHCQSPTLISINNIWGVN